MFFADALQADLVSLIKEFSDDTDVFRELWERGRPESVFQTLHYPAIQFEMGKRVGDYEIEEKLAQGGMGQILVAKDTVLGRRVLLKRAYPGPSCPANPRFWHLSESLRRRFRQEAEMTASLNHSGIVPIHALIEDELGIPYYVMRQLPGGDLQDFVRSIGRPREFRSQEGMKWLRETIRAVQSLSNIIKYIHSCNIIHRDIKPNNVFLGQFGEVLLLDFGLAKYIEGDEDPLDKICSIGGTTHYGAPELWTKSASFASDLYALGGVLYFVLTGSHPQLDINNDGKNQASENSRLIRPSQLCDSVPRQLEEICLKAMHLVPEKRYLSSEGSCVHCFAEDLERWLSDEPVNATQDTFVEGTSRFVRKNSRAIIVGTAALLALTALLAVSLIITNWLRGEALAQTQRANKSADLSVSTIGEIITRINGPLLMRDDTTDIHFVSLTYAATALDKLLQLEPKVYATTTLVELLCQRAFVEFSLAELEKKKPVGKSADKPNSREAQEKHVELGREFAQRAVELVEKAQRNGEQISDELIRRAKLYNSGLQLEHQEETLIALEKDLSARLTDQDSVPLRTELASVLLTQVSHLQKVGRIDEALIRADRSHSLVKKIPGPRSLEPALKILEMSVTRNDWLDAELAIESCLVRIFAPESLVYLKNGYTKEVLQKATGEQWKIVESLGTDRTSCERLSFIRNGLATVMAPQTDQSLREDIAVHRAFLANELGQASLSSQYCEQALQILRKDAPNSIYNRAQMHLIAASESAKVAEREKECIESLANASEMIAELKKLVPTASTDPGVKEIEQDIDRRRLALPQAIELEPFRLKDVTDSPRFANLVNELRFFRAVENKSFEAAIELHRHLLANATATDETKYFDALKRVAIMLLIRDDRLPLVTDARKLVLQASEAGELDSPIVWDALLVSDESLKPIREPIELRDQLFEVAQLKAKASKNSRDSYLQSRTLQDAKLDARFPLLAAKCLAGIRSKVNTELARSSIDSLCVAQLKMAIKLSSASTDIGNELSKLIETDFQFLMADDAHGEFLKSIKTTDNKTPSQSN